MIRDTGIASVELVGLSSTHAEVHLIWHGVKTLDLGFGFTHYLDIATRLTEAELRVPTEEEIEELRRRIPSELRRYFEPNYQRLAMGVAPQHGYLRIDALEGGFGIWAAELVVTESETPVYRYPQRAVPDF
jgi:hypothetical protein